MENGVDLEDELRSEYDASVLRNGVRGKYMDEYQHDAMDEYLSNLHQMSEGRLSPARMSVEPVEWHIFRSYQSLMTKWERQTLLYLSLRSYADACTNKSEYVKGHNKAKKLLRPEIEELLQRGEEAFLVSVRDRILQEHGSGILNLCPRCGALARTAQSKQCHKCFFSWHDKEGLPEKTRKETALPDE